MDKKHLRRLWNIVRPIKPWYILILCLLSVGVSIYALRQNNLTMVKLRNVVYAADKNNGDVNGALKNLQIYVVSHMNTDLAGGSNPIYPPIQLTNTYDRLQQAATDQAQAANQQIYTDAQTYCQQQDSTDFSGHNRVPCVESYVQSHGVQIPTIPTSLYEFDFISPSWSPDLAGWSIVVSIILFVLFVISWPLRWLLKRSVN